MRVVCLHTHPDNIRVFHDACPPGMHLIHHVRSDLLKRANDGIDNGLRAELQVQTTRLGRNAEAVLVTCSALRTAIPADCFSADAIVADQLEVLGAGKMLEVFYTNPGSTAQTTDLFNRLISPTETKISFIDGAWAHFMAGERNDYLLKIADAVERSEAEMVVFAQASMTAALSLCNRDVLNIPCISLPWLAAHLEMQVAQ